MVAEATLNTGGLQVGEPADGESRKFRDYITGITVSQRCIVLEIDPAGLDSDEAYA